MSWDARQTAMLQAMGLRVWARTPAAPADAEIDVALMPAPEPVAEPVAPAPEAPRRAAPAVRIADVLPPAAPPVAPTPDTGERAVQIAGMDWPALREAAAACRACGLCEGRGKSVFDAGQRQADWLFVGEIPGEDEDQAGEPFAGPPGKLLDNMLRAVGLGRGEGLPPEQSAYLASALKCRPPRQLNPGPAELVQCRPWLERQIALVQPKVILALGRLAVQSLLGSNEPLGKLRGRIHDFQGIPLVVSYPPAYLVRTPADKAGAWADLCLARDALAGRR